MTITDRDKRMRKKKTEKTQTKCHLTRKRQLLRTKTDSSPKTEKSLSSKTESDTNDDIQNRLNVDDVAQKQRRKYQCEVCQKEFGYSNDLRKHLRIHLDERPFSCTQCDKTFRQAGCLKNHIACQHGTDISYTCDYCTKSFPIKERLRLHLRIHSGFKPYTCLICMKKFARGGQVNINSKILTFFVFICSSISLLLHFYGRHWSLFCWAHEKSCAFVLKFHNFNAFGYVLSSRICHYLKLWACLHTHRETFLQALYFKIDALVACP